MLLKRSKLQSRRGHNSSGTCKISPTLTPFAGGASMNPAVAGGSWVLWCCRRKTNGKINWTSGIPPANSRATNR